MKESLDIIEEQMTYVNKIVSDLQDYAKPLNPKLEEVNVKDIVQTVLSSINDSCKLIRQKIFKLKFLYMEKTWEAQELIKPTCSEYSRT